VHPLPSPALGLFFHHDGMYARKWSLPLCVYSVGETQREAKRGTGHAVFVLPIAKGASFMQTLLYTVAQTQLRPFPKTFSSASLLTTADTQRHIIKIS
jgi:hypothetical protein